jgi:amino acid transporter
MWNKTRMNSTPSSENSDPSKNCGDDEAFLGTLGYVQELSRPLSPFSNFAISLSIICILAGGVTSFHVGFCGVGGAAIGVGWPLVALFSIAVAATMGQVASAFPTAGGLYHWASLLGGRGWGWITAWFNLAGLVTVLAAINVGTYRFAFEVISSHLGTKGTSLSADHAWTYQSICVGVITCSQAAVNHLGIRATARLTDLSGWLILTVASALTICLFAFAPGVDFRRLVHFQNLSGATGGHVWPASSNLIWLFAGGLLLPAYTITGFDASAHASEETMNAARVVPRGIVRSVLVSAIFGWVMLAAVVVTMKDPAATAARGAGAFVWSVEQALPAWLSVVLFAGIIAAQYLCGLATVTSASRMTFAFARDGGLPYSHQVRRVSPKRRSPAVAIWLVSCAAIAFTWYTPVYDTIAVVCTVFLYVSYVIPTALGFFAVGRRWKTLGPWNLGIWYRPLALIAVFGCGALILIGIQPPNEKAGWVVGAALACLLAAWHFVERSRFPGPPVMLEVNSKT